MSHLFTFNDKIVFHKEEILMIDPFDKIWERDKSKGKEVALQEFAYIEFMVSMMKTNPFREYPEEKKEEIIIKEVIKIKNWKPDELVKKAMKRLVEFQTEGSLTYKYWMSAKIALEKQIEFFERINVNERNLKTGNPIYKPKDIPDAVANAEKVLTTINTLKTKVDEEIFESSKTRSDKVISAFADPNSLKSL